MKKVFLFLVTVFALIAVNNLYFEYCVSRELPDFLIVLATIAVLLLDILGVVHVIKLLSQILKL